MFSRAKQIAYLTSKQGCRYPGTRIAESSRVGCLETSHTDRIRRYSLISGIGYILMEAELIGLF